MIIGRKGIIRYTYVFLTIISVFNNRASAQLLTPAQPSNYWLALAEEQYNQQHYTLAAQSASNYISGHNRHLYAASKDALEKAAYFRVLSQLKISKQGCADSADAFIKQTSNPAYKQRASYHLAQYHFNANNFGEAISCYELAGIANLNNREIANSKFELAYCYFNNKQFEEAEQQFASIKEIEGKYYDAGNYYYGLLAYNREKYPDALRSFERIADNKEYRDIVPYYIAEIYYFTGNKQKALEDAERLIKRKEKLYYDNELHLLAAQVLFEQEKYSDALPYFEYYYNKVDKIRKEDLYEMAYCYFMVQQWEDAIDKFKPLSSTRDSLGQSAMYLLGDCYLKTENRKSARNAFTICADMPFNRGQQEASLLLAAKLSYEMGYNDEAINYINELLRLYPSSRFHDEASTLLSDLLIRTNNYREAYASLQDITNHNAEYWRVNQKVTYGYALLQLQDGNISMADELLTASLQKPVDEVYEAAANFWKGDVSFQLHRYNDAIIYTERFLKAGGNTKVQRLSHAATTSNAYLNLGYASMENKDFKAAKEYFNLARNPADQNSEMAVNMMLREADAAFMQKEFGEAALLYDKVIALNSTESDYARYQKSILLGLQGKNSEKAALLKALINTTPPSPYALDARYEIALTYIEEDKYQAAIKELLPLTEAHERLNMPPRALMKIGFCYQQQTNTEKAIESYRRIVTDYPSSDEKPAALDALKSLYLQNNQPDLYAQLLRENNISSDDRAIDSAFYTAAETQFAAAKWDAAKKAFAAYLEKYPNGAFAIKAHYYKAESHQQLKEYDKALADYESVLSMPWNNFSENSARKASAIAMRNNDFSRAFNSFTALRNNAMTQESLLVAYTGLMQTSYEMTNFENADAYADTVLSLAEAESEATNDALLYKARALSKQGKDAEALVIYKQLGTSKKPAILCEAQYHIAASYYKNNQLKEAETIAGNAIQAGGSDYWVVKSYILIADILTKQKDYFNAKATLQSIVKNTRIAELKQEATAKLEEVKALEKKQSKLSD